ncbi:MAG TPA: hypothetical protein VMG08_04930 [Allosphingosinicella sp.]|nr:hypothetical protein [Allosphingosinicella sp.]
MRKLAFVPLGLLCIGAAPAPNAAQPAAPDATAAKAPSAEARPGEILLTPPAHCLDAAPRRTGGQSLQSRRLDQLPQGDLTLTVVREVNGCPQPATIREGYGAAPFRAPEPRR